MPSFYYSSCDLQGAEHWTVYPVQTRQGYANPRGGSGQGRDRTGDTWIFSPMPATDSP